MSKLEVSGLAFTFYGCCLKLKEFIAVVKKKKKIPLSLPQPCQRDEVGKAASLQIVGTYFRTMHSNCNECWNSCDSKCSNICHVTLFVQFLLAPFLSRSLEQPVLNAISFIFGHVVFSSSIFICRRESIHSCFC